jgi:hypothetical protein
VPHVAIRQDRTAAGAMAAPRFRSGPAGAPEAGMTQRRVTRRYVLGRAAAAAAAALAAPHVRGARAAGRLSVGILDHPMPAVGQTFRALCEQWADLHRVEIVVDTIDGSTATAEAHDRSGHDILTHPNWQLLLHRRMLEPVDDVVAGLIANCGGVGEAADYLGRFDGAWRGVPATPGNALKSCCSRLDLYRDHCGLDLARVFPVGEHRDAAQVEAWNWDRYLETAAELHKAGFPVGLPIGHSSDAVDWLSALFRSFGSLLVDAQGTIRIASDETRAALEYLRRLTAFNAPGAHVWDDSGNNHWLITGKGAGIINPPTAWFFARAENPPVAATCWTHDVPRGPAGRYVAAAPAFYGIWSFAENKPSAKELLSFICAREQTRRLVAAAEGGDLPPFAGLTDFDTWRVVGPPPGTLYNYPARGDERPTIPGFPARPDVAYQIYNRAVLPTMVAKVTRDGGSIDSAIAWANGELEGILCRRPADHCA